ncbi:alpha-ketoglutarate-dependent dioxygenase AlkB family protein [Oceanibium sediminis]|uniref:alpha-ketoglutarate-dependent dioxygenase AlkB family protein n=1 Tax=Oceanibium sediminis TaxID=2026339 RepID=UPI0018E501FD|nr:alpha-ketoglutarate-dependent dioxygenase AlkB [Oceanibium sediminis]
MATQLQTGVEGLRLWKGWLTPDAQAQMVETVRTIVRQAPLTRHVTPGGKRMGVRMTCAGALGWVSDRTGYRYQAHHPAGMAWPPIPEPIQEIWRQASGVSRAPDCCLVNFYGEGVKMGLHQDSDEADLSWPVLSISLGDPALFRIGGTERGGKTQSLWLESGDVLVMSGPARLRYHGIDRIRFGASTLLSEGGRVNLTLRVAG